MPELPEVETVMRGLAPSMQGAVIEKADVNRADLRWPFPQNMAERLAGRRVIALRRRSKYILADLDSDETLLVHLGMSGRMTVSGDPLGQFVHDHPPQAKHDHVVFHMDNGARITFNDPRRFGAMDLFATAEETGQKLLAVLGPEPFANDLTGAHLVAAFAGRRTAVKSLLLDQRIIAGLGNIYVCEVLFRAGIAPQRAGGRIAASRVDSLLPLIRQVLSEAIDAGGSSLRDFRQANGELGYFQHSFDVYGREHAPCRREGCDGTVQRIVQGGRSSFYCGKCQR